MNVIARRREDFTLLIELSDLLRQQGHIRPSRSVSIRNPSCSKISKAVNEEFHVRLACSFAEQVGNGERPPKQCIAVGNFTCTLCDHREGEIAYGRGQFIRRDATHG